MAKTTITFGEIIDLNHKLESENIRFKVHLHDACGNQSFTVEPLADTSSDEQYEMMKSEISGYFKEKSIVIRFFDNNLGFVLL